MLGARLATITMRHPQTGRERSWPVTQSDVDAMARMLVAEDGFYRDNPEKGYRVGRVMASMLLRRLAVVFFDGPYTSVEHLMRGNPNGGNPKGWSQPMRYWGLHHDSEELKAMYRRHQNRPLEEVPEYYRRAALDTLTGRVPLLLPGVVDAAAPRFTADKLASGRYPDWRREHPTEARSWLISTGRSRSWPEPTVSSGGGGGSLVGPVLGVALLLGLAFAKWKGV